MKRTPLLKNADNYPMEANISFSDNSQGYKKLFDRHILP